MSALPQALARWEPELSRLPRELAHAIGPWLGRIELGVGPLAHAAQGGDAEPDGVGALARRGPYERLLASEWLFADEAPEEFLRRAASGEHLFLSIARRAPRASRRSVALFDAGPAQLGAPRLAHLALWIVLARRARAAGVRFAWGVLQDPEVGLREELDASAVHALLEARTPREPSGAMLEAWAQLLGTQRDETWAIVAPRSAAMLASLGAATVAVEDPLDRNARRLLVHVARRGGTRTLELTLPSDDECTRVLRRPVPDGGATKPSPVGAPRGTLFGFPGDGRRLVVHTASGFLSWGVPGSPSADAGAPRRLVLGPDEQLLAAGHRGRRLLAIATDGDALIAIGLGTEKGADGRIRARCAFEGDAPIWASDTFLSAFPAFRQVAFAALAPADPAALTFVAPDDTLVNLRLEKAGRLVQTTHASEVRAFHPLVDGAVVVTQPPEGTTVQIIADGQPDRVLLCDTGVPAGAVFVGAIDRRPVIAYAVDRDLTTFRFTDVAGNRFIDLHAPAGTRTVGAHADRECSHALVIIEPGGRAVSLIGRDRARPIATSSGAIESACTSPRGGIVGWRTTDGWIELASIHQACVVLRIPPEAGA